RVGSSNLSERSMCLDSECDLAVESLGDDRVATAIRGLRNGLLAEHLGATVHAVEQALARHGRLIPAVESLAGGSRTLAIFEPLDSEKLDEPILEDSLIDPAEPLDMAVLAQAMPREASQYGIRRLPWVLAFVLIVLALAAVWAFTPLGDWVTPANLAATAMPLGHHALGPVIAALGVALGTTVLIPVTVLVVAANLIFGPLVGPITTMAGCLLSAALSYSLGRVLWSDAIKRLTGPRLSRLTRKLPRRGVLTMVAIRIVPIAPFTVINLMAGSAAFRFRDFLIGTVIGLLPGICGLTFATDRVAAAVRNPDPLSIALAVVAVALIAAAMWGLRTWLVRRARGNPRRSPPVPRPARQAICNLGKRTGRHTTAPATRNVATAPVKEPIRRRASAARST
ncbi:MAG TPA: VTT domain-containing protein, partial [Haliangium sp.]|nr:VTT domain-containing protein [Haliangium sp.]